MARMANIRRSQRRIALFVEGDTERGDARRRTLPTFFHKWLDPQLPVGRRVGIQAVNFGGVGNFLADVADEVEAYLDAGRANFVVGLVDLYGLTDHINLSNSSTVAERIKKSRQHIRGLIAPHYQTRFRQHFAVHEVEAWLLAYPERFSSEVRPQIEKRPPEQVNFHEPPAAFLKRLLGRRYKKTVMAMNVFPFVDPRQAIGKCPFLKLLADDLLRLAQGLQ
jgi:hypothetical protein